MSDEMRHQGVVRVEVFRDCPWPEVINNESVLSVSRMVRVPFLKHNQDRGVGGVPKSHGFDPLRKRSYKKKHYILAVGVVI